MLAQGPFTKEYFIQKSTPYKRKTIADRVCVNFFSSEPLVILLCTHTITDQFHLPSIATSLVLVLKELGKAEKKIGNSKYLPCYHFL